jgi:RPA family protein
VRFPAVRVFIDELAKVTQDKREQLERFTIVKVPLKGIDVARVMVAGVVVGVREREKFAVVEVADTTGRISVFTEKTMAEELSPGMAVAIVGKPRVVSGRAAIRAEKIIKINRTLYMYLQAQAAECAKRRGAEVPAL